MLFFYYHFVNLVNYNNLMDSADQVKASQLFFCMCCKIKLL